LVPKVVTARTAAQIVGLSESTLAKLRLNGNGPVYCKLGRRVVYRPADLEQWLQSRTTRDTSGADARFLKALTIAHPRWAMGSRHPNPRLAKIHRNYSVEDASRLCGIHKNKVRNWLREGLKPIDDQRPTLI
jgi:predicted DNA-binding transcriptional regulator AlpA